MRPEELRRQVPAGTDEPASSTSRASLARILRHAMRHAAALGLSLAAITTLVTGCGGPAADAVGEGAIDARADATNPWSERDAADARRNESLLETLPARLSDTGLYADFAARTLAPDVLVYEPQYPLWTDGAVKRRWIRLPPGTSIDASNPDVWSFPVGTRLWKEFALERRIETRFMLRLGDGRWLQAAYVWNADETDAVLAPEEGVRAAAHSAPGGPYDVPARTDCNACHAAGPNAVLGFSALQLSGDRDPLAPHAQVPAPGAVDLDELLRREIVRNLPQDLVEQPPRIAAADPIERAALGYLHGNCGMCHTDAGQLASLDLDLWTSLAGAPDHNALRTTVEHESRFRFPCKPGKDTGPASAVASRGATHDPTQAATGDAADGRPAFPVRIAPGDPEASVLLRRMRSRQPLSQMPPLGTHARDDEGIALISAWILARAGRPPHTSSPVPTSTLSHHHR